MKSSLFVFFFLLFVPLVSQSSLFDVLHEKGEQVHMVLDTEWKDLVRERSEKQDQPLKLTLIGLGDTLNFAGRVRSRGNIRLEVCQYPSLLVKLKKKELKAAGFSDLNDLKFVLQCSNDARGEGYSVREKLVYDLHAIYSEHHHRTVPATISPASDESQVLRAFVVESEEQLAARYQGRIIAPERMSTTGLERASYVNMCMFNYLILNTDWHVFNRHNIEFVNPEGSLDLISIPYDFDYSGFVGAHYAIPREELDITSIYVPKWLGKNVTEAELKEEVAHFLTRRTAAETLIREYPELDERNRKRMLRRMEEFYKLLGNEKKMLKMLK